ncbi:MAG: DUF2336 domain-containing protein [Alphaproteobacteria bacterium]|nr:DUF2336 domain-containing protein [Alphaproteobacteria bacterium]
MGLIDRLLGRKPGTKLAFDEAKQLVRHENPEVRRELAQRGDIRPELLYFLAEDKDAAVRRAIADNETTPRQADLLLASDADLAVRTGVVEKIATVLPKIGEKEQGRAREATAEVLTVLAQDQVVRVREILADTLKDLAIAPPDVVRRLAADQSLTVSLPVLQHSPVLTDDDLLGIVASSTVDERLRAVARRPAVSTRVADAVVATGNESAVAALLGNTSAQIREETLDRLIEQAPARPSWHPPLVRRPKLPARAMVRLATFVARSLVEELKRRSDLDPATATAVSEVVEKRIASDPAWASDAPTTADPEAEETGESLVEREHRRALTLKEQGELNDELVRRAIAAGQRPFVVAALSAASGLTVRQVEDIIASKNAKAVVALVWKGGFGMDLAYQAQLRLAAILPRVAVDPADDGGYPMSEGELSWQLEGFAEKS